MVAFTTSTPSIPAARQRSSSSAICSGVPVIRPERLRSFAGRLLFGAADDERQALEELEVTRGPSGFDGQPPGIGDQGPRGLGCGRLNELGFRIAGGEPAAGMR